MFTCVKSATWWIMLRIGGSIWAAAIIAVYGDKESIGLYTTCGYTFYEIIVNSGVSWAFYPTNWMTEIDESNYKKYEQKAFLIRRKFRQGEFAEEDNNLIYQNNQTENPLSMMLNMDHVEYERRCELIR